MHLIIVCPPTYEPTLLQFCTRKYRAKIKGGKTLTLREETQIILRLLYENTTHLQSCTNVIIAVPILDQRYYYCTP